MKGDTNLTTYERQKKAEAIGIVNDIGKKVRASDMISCFRYGDVAEIVGWGIMPDNNRPVYYIRFENGECDSIPAGRLFKESGFEFVE